MNILIADDHGLFREGIRLLLEQLGDLVISEAKNRQEIHEQLSQGNTIDLLLLDLNMPGINSFEGVKDICASLPYTTVAVMSGNDANYIIEACLNAGALGFIPKSSSGKVMIHAIQMMMSGERYIPSKLFDGKRKLLPHGSADISPRQQEVWALLAEGKSNKAIADVLGVSESTVKKHVTALLRKLGVHSRAEAMHKAQLIQK